MRHCVLLREAQLRSSPAYHLTGAFSQEHVQQQLGLRDCAIAQGCRLGILSMQEGDVLVWGAQQNCAGLCQFFVERGSSLQVCMRQLRLRHSDVAQLVFDVTNDRACHDVTGMPFLRHPAWTHASDGTVVCLL
jgi:hypothetical protein